MCNGDCNQGRMCDCTPQVDSALYSGVGSALAITIALVSACALIVNIFAGS